MSSGALLPKLVEAHTTQIRDGRLNGTEITFRRRPRRSGPRVFRGRVEGDTIVGIAPQGWKATLRRSDASWRNS